MLWYARQWSAPELDGKASPATPLRLRPCSLELPEPTNADNTLAKKTEADIIAPAERPPVSIVRELGYCFDLCIVHDSKPGSRFFALAGARYNVVKVVI